MAGLTSKYWNYLYLLLRAKAELELLISEGYTENLGTELCGVENLNEELSYIKKRIQEIDADGAFTAKLGEIVLPKNDDPFACLFALKGFTQDQEVYRMTALETDPTEEFEAPNLKLDMNSINVLAAVKDYRGALLSYLNNNNNDDTLRRKYFAAITLLFKITKVPSLATFNAIGLLYDDIKNGTGVMFGLNQKEAKTLQDALIKYQAALFKNSNQSIEGFNQAAKAKLGEDDNETQSLKKTKTVWIKPAIKTDPPNTDTNTPQGKLNQALKALYDAQFNFNYMSPQVGFGAIFSEEISKKYQALKSASVNYLKARKNYVERISEHNANTLAEDLRKAGEQFSTQNPNISFRVLSDELDVNNGNTAFENLFNLYPDEDEQYCHRLWDWMNLEAIAKANPKNRDNEIFAGAQLQVLKDHVARVKEHKEKNKKRNLPAPNASINELVEHGIVLALDTKTPDAQSLKNWQMLQAVAEIKFGPGALLRAYQKRLTHVHEDKDYLTPHRYRAFKKACIILAGLTIIAACVAVAVLSYGALSAPAVMGVKIGALVLCSAFAAPAGYSAGRMHFLNKSMKQSNQYKSLLNRFAKHENQQDRTELPAELPRLKKSWCCG